MFSRRLIRPINIALLVIACGTIVLAQSAPTVSRIDPPSWWSNHSINPVRLLIQGRNLDGAKVSSSDRRLRASAIKVNEQGTALLVDLNINPGMTSGDYSLTVETSRGRTTFPFKIEAPLNSTSNFQGITANDVIYLIMIDRFANGDPRNDVPNGAPSEATDRQNARAYHGGDLRGVIDHLVYLKELGVTAIWLTPWYDNWNGVNRCGQPWCPNTYYHGYHAIDYYSVEDHFGDLKTLGELVSKAHALGLKVIQDQVANHVGSQHPWLKDPPLPNWFHGTLGQHQRNRFQNSVLLSPHSNPANVVNTLDGWFSDDLPDVNQDEPEVARYEIQNALWWVGVTGIDGIRQDTIQYMPRSFIRSLSDALHRQYPKMWMVGEVFERDAAQTSFFIGGHTGWDGIDTKLDSVFDFPLWNTSLAVFTNKLPMTALREQLKYDALYPSPTHITVLANNHDTARFLSLSGGSATGSKLHTAFVLTVRGIPQLYYGEEIAMEGKDDPDNRRDFPGGFLSGPNSDSRNAFNVAERTPVERDMFDWTRSWLHLRAEHSALRTGKLIDLFADNDVYVFARQDSGDCVIVAINRGEKSVQTEVQASSLGWKGIVANSLLGSGRSSRDSGAKIILTIPPRTAVAFKAEPV
ncbi:MAG TPA: alpha-amylase family glycosyl hydrolase [Pyrinomonadaceae bacterium]